MFRDESSKVREKAHAQWGAGPGEGCSSLTSPSLSPFQSAWSARSPLPDDDAGSTSPTALTPRLKGRWPASGLIRPLGPTTAEQGIHFYVDRYVLGYPDGPRRAEELQDCQWVFHPAVQNIMAAIGLAAMSNLTRDANTRFEARQNYVLALQQTGKALMNPGTLKMDMALRNVVMLAMFEVRSTLSRSPRTSPSCGEAHTAS